MTFVDFTPLPPQTETRSTTANWQWPQAGAAAAPAAAEDTPISDSQVHVEALAKYPLLRQWSSAYFTVRTGVVNFNDAILRIAHSAGFWNMNRPGLGTCLPNTASSNTRLVKEISSMATSSSSSALWGQLPPIKLVYTTSFLATFQSL